MGAHSVLDNIMGILHWMDVFPEDMIYTAVRTWKWVIEEWVTKSMVGDSVEIPERAWHLNFVKDEWEFLFPNNVTDTE